MRRHGMQSSQETLVLSEWCMGRESALVECCEGHRIMCWNSMPPITSSFA